MSPSSGDGTSMWVLGMVGSPEYGVAIRTIEVDDAPTTFESIHPLSDGRLGNSADLRRIRRIQARVSTNQWEVLDDQHSLDSVAGRVDKGACRKSVTFG